MIPEKVKVGGIKYDIELTNPSLTDSYGKTIFEKAKIYIDDNIVPDMALATILHEVIEIINEENELKLNHNQIQTLATQMFQVLKDNPKVFND